MFNVLLSLFFTNAGALSKNGGITLGLSFLLASQHGSSPKSGEGLLGSS